MPNYNLELQQAVIDGKEIKILEELIKQGASFENKTTYGFNLLHLAVQYNRLPIITWLLAQTNFDFLALTPIEQNILHIALSVNVSANEKIKIVTELLNKLPSNIKQKLFMQVDANGKYPFYYALVDGTPELTELLIQHGQAVTTAVDEVYQSHPLHVAAFYGNTKLIAPLLNAKALTEVKNKNGETPYDLVFLRAPHWALDFLYLQFPIKKIITLDQKSLEQLSNWKQDIYPKLIKAEDLFEQKNYKQAEIFYEELCTEGEKHGVLSLQIICCIRQGTILLKQNKYCRALLLYKTAQVLFNQFNQSNQSNQPSQSNQSSQLNVNESFDDTFEYDTQFKQYSKLVESCFMQEECGKPYQKFSYDPDEYVAELITNKSITKEYFLFLQNREKKNEKTIEEKDFQIKEKEIFSPSICDKKIKTVLSDITEYNKKLFKKILVGVEYELGTPPCVYAAVFIGSGSKKLMTLCSDIEWMIFIDPKNSLKKEKSSKTLSPQEIKQYFLHFTQLAHLKLLQLGETPYPHQRESNDTRLKKMIDVSGCFLSPLPQGTRLDEDLLNPFALSPYELQCQDDSKCLFGTPQELIANFQNKEIMDSDVNRYYSLQSVEYVYGTTKHGELLVKEYQDGIKNYLNQKIPLSKQTVRQQQALSLLALNLEEFNFDKAGGKDFSQLSFNVKKELYRAIAMIVQHLSCYYGIDTPNPWDAIKELENKKLLHAKNAKYLSAALNLIMTLRLKAQMHYGTEYEQLWLISADAKVDIPPLLNQYKPPLIVDEQLLTALTEIYKILFPLHWCAKKWLSSPNNKIFVNPIVLQNPGDACFAKGFVCEKLGKREQSETHYYFAKNYYTNAIKTRKDDLHTYLHWINCCYFLTSQLKNNISKHQQQINQWTKNLCQQLIAEKISAENYLFYYESLSNATRSKFKKYLERREQKQKKKKSDNTTIIYTYILQQLEQSKPNNCWFTYREKWEKNLSSANGEEPWFKCIKVITASYELYKNSEESKDKKIELFAKFTEKLNYQAGAFSKATIFYLFMLHYLEIAIEKRKKDLQDAELEQKNAVKELIKKIFYEKKLYQPNDYLPYYQELTVEVRQQFRQELITIQQSSVNLENEKKLEPSKNLFLSAGKLEKIIFSLNSYPDETGKRPLLLQEQIIWERELHALHLASNTKEKVYATGKEIYIVSNIIGTRLLKPEIAKQLLNENFSFKEHKINHSIHDVIRIELSDVENNKWAKSVIYVKANPEMPGMSYFIGEIYRRLIGHGVPYSELAKIQCGDKSIIVQISQGIEQDEIKQKEIKQEEIKQEKIKQEEITEKKLNIEKDENKKCEEKTNKNTSFFDILQNHPEELDNLSLSHYQELTLVAMIIRPGDDREPNWIWKTLANNSNVKNVKKLCTLINIDYERALFSEWIEEIDEKTKQKTGILKANVNTILYCLEQAKCKIIDEVKQKICAINPLEFMRKLLQDAQRQNQVYAFLFTQQEMADLYKKNKDGVTIIPIPIKSGDATMLYHRLCQIQSFLKNPKNKDASILDCLIHITPALGTYYAKLLNDKNLTPSKRLQKALNLKIDQRTGISISALNKTAVLSGSVLIENNICKLQEIDPAQGLSELDFIAYQENILDEIRKEVQQGNLAKFKQLISPEHKRIVICGDKKNPGISFGEGGLQEITIQTQLLNLCEGVAFKKLQLKNCHALQSKILQKLLAKSYDLQSLEIYDCSPFASEYLKLIAEKCKALKYLKLKNLPSNVVKLSGLKFENLISLKIVGNKGLVEIGNIDAPNLMSLKISDNSSLTSVYDIVAPQLNNINVSDNPSLEMLGQDTQAIVFPELNHFILKNNKNLKSCNIVALYVHTIQIDNCGKAEEVFKSAPQEMQKSHVLPSTIFYGCCYEPNLGTLALPCYFGGDSLNKEEIIETIKSGVVDNNGSGTAKICANTYKFNIVIDGPGGGRYGRYGLDCEHNLILALNGPALDENGNKLVNGKWNDFPGDMGVDLRIIRKFYPTIMAQVVFTYWSVGNFFAFNTNNRSIGESYHKKADINIWCFNITNRESFGAYSQWEERYYRNKQPKLGNILVGTHCDLEKYLFSGGSGTREVSIEEGEKLAEEMAFYAENGEMCVGKYVECSVKTGEGFDKLWRLVEESALSRVKKPGLSYEDKNFLNTLNQLGEHFNDFLKGLKSIFEKLYKYRFSSSFSSSFNEPLVKSLIIPLAANSSHQIAQLNCVLEEVMNALPSSNNKNQTIKLYQGLSLELQEQTPIFLGKVKLKYEEQVKKLLSDIKKLLLDLKKTEQQINDRANKIKIEKEKEIENSKKVVSIVTSTITTTANTATTDTTTTNTTTNTNNPIFKPIITPIINSNNNSLIFVNNSNNNSSNNQQPTSNYLQLPANQEPMKK